MKIGLCPQRARTFIALAASWLIAVSGGIEALAQTEEPIAYIGHGSFFDRMGNEIQVTQAFVEKAQAWYRADLLSKLDDPRKHEFAEFEQRLHEGVQMKGQTRLVVQQRALELLFASSPRHKDDDRMLGKLHALEYGLSWRLPEQPGQYIGDRREEFKLDPDLARKRESTQFKPSGGIQLLSATTNLGQAYINECMAARVPIPKPIGVLNPNGTSGWKSQGFIPIPQQFIGQPDPPGSGPPSPAEVRTY